MTIVAGLCLTLESCSLFSASTNSTIFLDDYYFPFIQLESSAPNKKVEYVPLVLPLDYVNDFFLRNRLSQNPFDVQILKSQVLKSIPIDYDSDNNDDDDDDDDDGYQFMAHFVVVRPSIYRTYNSVGYPIKIFHNKRGIVTFQFSDLDHNLYEVEYGSVSLDTSMLLTHFESPIKGQSELLAITEIDDTFRQSEIVETPHPALYEVVSGINIDNHSFVTHNNRRINI